MSNSLTFPRLVESIGEVHRELARQAKQAVNVCLTVRNWLIGAYIHEYELKGADQSDYYGEGLLPALADHLKQVGVRGTGQRQLYRYLSFYRAYPEILPTLSAQSLLTNSGSTPRDILPTLSAQSAELQTTLVQSLSFSHFNELSGLDSEAKRRFYEEHCLKARWSVRELKRQIASLYFERTALSTDKGKLVKLTESATETEPSSFPIRDPYIFEFLGLKPEEVMEESTLESALLDKLQTFLLELGHGFCFEARQKRILLGETYHFVDLVFYHRVLKCHVLIELKVGSFTHEHIGQLNTYVSWYADQETTDGDNPPVGLLLCTEKDNTVVKYALAGMSNQLFVSKYQVALPTPEQLAAILPRSIQHHFEENN